MQTETYMKENIQDEKSRKKKVLVAVLLLLFSASVFATTFMAFLARLKS